MVHGKPLTPSGETLPPKGTPIVLCQQVGACELWGDVLLLREKECEAWGWGGGCPVEFNREAEKDKLNFIFEKGREKWEETSRQSRRARVAKSVPEPEPEMEYSREAEGETPLLCTCKPKMLSSDHGSGID